MTEALTVLAVIAGLAAVLLTARLLVQLWHDWAEDRRREAEYADAWCRTHLAHQHDRHEHGRWTSGQISASTTPSPIVSAPPQPPRNRYLTDTDGAPE